MFSHHVFQLELIYLYFPLSSHLIYVCFCPVGLSSTVNCRNQETEVTSTPTRTVDNVVITTIGLQDRNIHILGGTTVEKKGKLILTEDMCLAKKIILYSQVRSTHDTNGKLFYIVRKGILCLREANHAVDKKYYADDEAGLPKTV